MMPVRYACAEHYPDFRLPKKNKMAAASKVPVSGHTTKYHGSMEHLFPPESAHGDRSFAPLRAHAPSHEALIIDRLHSSTRPTGQGEEWQPLVRLIPAGVERGRLLIFYSLIRPWGVGGSIHLDCSATTAGEKNRQSVASRKIQGVASLQLTHRVAARMRTRQGSQWCPSAGRRHSRP